MEGEIISASAVPQSNAIIRKEKSGMPSAPQIDKFSEAEKRLREELAAFKLK